MRKQWESVRPSLPKAFSSHSDMLPSSLFTSSELACPTDIHGYLSRGAQEDVTAPIMLKLCTLISSVSVWPWLIQEGRGCCLLWSWDHGQCLEKSLCLGWLQVYALKSGIPSTCFQDVWVGLNPSISPHGIQFWIWVSLKSPLWLSPSPEYKWGVRERCPWSREDSNPQKQAQPPPADFSMGSSPGEHFLWKYSSVTL